MSTPNISFIRRPRPPMLGITILVIGVCLMIAFSLATVTETKRLADLRRSVTASAKAEAAARTELGTTKPDPVKLAGEQRRRSIHREMSAPWGLLFSAIEKSHTDAIRLTLVDPSITGRSVHIRGEASDVHELADYVIRLDGNGLKQPMVSTERGNGPMVAGSAVVFELTAGWSADER